MILTKVLKTLLSERLYKLYFEKHFFYKVSILSFEEDGMYLTEEIICGLIHGLNTNTALFRAIRTEFKSESGSDDCH